MRRAGNCAGGKDWGSLMFGSRGWLAVLVVLLSGAGATAAPLSVRLHVPCVAAVVGFTVPLGTVPIDE